MSNTAAMGDKFSDNWYYALSPCSQSKRLDIRCASYTYDGAVLFLRMLHCSSQVHEASNVNLEAATKRCKGTYI